MAWWAIMGGIGETGQVHSMPCQSPQLGGGGKGVAGKDICGYCGCPLKLLNTTAFTVCCLSSVSWSLRFSTLRTQCW